jgi:hypothetical protein
MAIASANAADYCGKPNIDLRVSAINEMAPAAWAAWRVV